MWERPGFSILVFVGVLVSCGLPAEARLGEPIQAFKNRVAGAYKAKPVTKKEDRSYHMFSLMPSNEVKEKTPGFGVGITATVVDGKIVGQSMAIRFGDNYDAGKKLGALYTMDFAYESIGKPPPKSKEAVDVEVGQFAMAIEQVLAGNSQHVSYPGFAYRITMSRTKEGDLLIAVTPDFTEKKPSGAAEPKKSK